MTVTGKSDIVIVVLESVDFVVHELYEYGAVIKPPEIKYIPVIHHFWAVFCRIFGTRLGTIVTVT